MENEQTLLNKLKLKEEELENEICEINNENENQMELLKTEYEVVRNLYILKINDLCVLNSILLKITVSFFEVFESLCFKTNFVLALKVCCFYLHFFQFFLKSAQQTLSFQNKFVFLKLISYKFFYLFIMSV